MATFQPVRTKLIKKLKPATFRNDHRMALTFREKLLEESYHLRIASTTPSQHDKELVKMGEMYISRSGANYVNGICFNNEEFSDLQLRLNDDEEHTYFAHRVTLVGRSEYFRTRFMTTSEWKESSAVLDLAVEPHLLGVFEEFLKFIYTGKLELRRSVIWPMYFLADEYMVESLKAFLVDFICNTLLEAFKDDQHQTKYKVVNLYPIEDVVDFIQCFDDDRVKRFAGAVILDQLPKIKDERWNSLNKSAVLALLNAETITKTSASVVSEFRLLQIVMGWINADQSRQEHAEKLLSGIRYGRMNDAGELHTISRHEYVAKSPLLSRLVAIATQEIFFAKARNKAPTHEAHVEYQAPFDCSDESQYLFKCRVANETLLCKCETSYSSRNLPALTPLNQ